MEGRWTIYPCPACGLATGRHKGCEVERPATPVVPCDDAAVERAIAAVNLAHESKINATWRELLEVAFRAAGETP